MENPTFEVADCIPPGSSDVEDPSLGVTDGGGGLPCQGCLVDVERAVCNVIEVGRDLRDNPHANKSENMKANKSFMVFTLFFPTQF